MINAWGQKIEVGSVVYRGARDGSSSTYKIGKVLSLKDGKPPRIDWLFEQSGRWIDVGDKRFYYPFPCRLKNSQGSPSADSLVLIDVDLDEIERQADFFGTIDYNTKFRDEEEFHHALDSHRM